MISTQMINAPKSAEIVMAKEIHCLTSGRYSVTDQRSLRSHLTGACASSQWGNTFLIDGGAGGGDRRTENGL